MDQQGVKRVKVYGAIDKRLIPAVFYRSFVCDILPIQAIYQGKTAQCHPRYEFWPEWNITLFPKHWSNNTTIIIVAYIDSAWQAFQDDTPALIITDNFKGQITSSVTSLSKKKKTLHLLASSE